jgi:hypothetical protein
MEAAITLWEEHRQLAVPDAVLFDEYVDSQEELGFSVNPTCWHSEPPHFEVGEAGGLSAPWTSSTTCHSCSTALQARRAQA